jgi:hypothetical protein
LYQLIYVSSGLRGFAVVLLLYCFIFSYCFCYARLVLCFCVVFVLFLCGVCVFCRLYNRHLCSQACTLINMPRIDYYYYKEITLFKIYFNVSLRQMSESHSWKMWKPSICCAKEVHVEVWLRNDCCSYKMWNELICFRVINKVYVIYSCHNKCFRFLFILLMSWDTRRVIQILGLNM